MHILPSNLSLIEPMQHSIYGMTQSNCFVRIFVARLVNVVAGSVLAALSAIYQLNFILKVPIVILNITIGMIPIGKGRDLGTFILPKGFTLKETALHVWRIFFFTLDIVICPVVGFFSPKGNYLLHRNLGIIEAAPKDKKGKGRKKPAQVAADAPEAPPLTPPATPKPKKAAPKKVGRRETTRSSQSPGSPPKTGSGGSLQGAPSDVMEQLKSKLAAKQRKITEQEKAEKAAKAEKERIAKAQADLEAQQKAEQAKKAALEAEQKSKDAEAPKEVASSRPTSPLSNESPESTVDANPEVDEGDGEDTLSLFDHDEEPETAPEIIVDSPGAADEQPKSSRDISVDVNTLPPTLRLLATTPEAATVLKHKGSISFRRQFVVEDETGDSGDFGGEEPLAVQTSPQHSTSSHKPRASMDFFSSMLSNISQDERIVRFEANSDLDKSMTWDGENTPAKPPAEPAQLAKPETPPAVTPRRKLDRKIIETLGRRLSGHEPQNS